MGSSSSPPPAPNYAQAAQDTAAGNLKNAQAAQIASNPNQSGMFGGYTYTPSSDPTKPGSYNQYLSPAKQQLFNQNQGVQNPLADSAATQAGNVQNAMSNPLTMNGMQQANVQNNGNAQQFNNDAANASYANSTQYLDPQVKQHNESLDAQLANKGITAGSEAYANAHQQNDANNN